MSLATDLVDLILTFLTPEEMWLSSTWFRRYAKKYIDGSREGHLRRTYFLFVAKLNQGFVGQARWLAGAYDTKTWRKDLTAARKAWRVANPGKGPDPLHVRSPVNPKMLKIITNASAAGRFETARWIIEHWELDVHRGAGGKRTSWFLLCLAFRAACAKNNIASAAWLADLAGLTLDDVRSSTLHAPIRELWKRARSQGAGSLREHAPKVRALWRLVDRARHGDVGAAAVAQAAAGEGLIRNVDYTGWVLDAYVSACSDGSVETARWIVQRFAAPREDCDLVAQTRAETLRKSLGAEFPARDPREINRLVWE